MKPFYCKVWKSWMETLECCEDCDNLKTEIIGGKYPRDKDGFIRYCNHILMCDIRRIEYWENYIKDWCES